VPDTLLRKRGTIRLAIPKEIHSLEQVRLPLPISADEEIDSAAEADGFVYEVAELVKLKVDKAHA